MSTKWRKHSAVAVLLAVGLAVTACDPGEDPTNPPTSETTAPVTTEPTEPDTTAGPPEIEPPEPPDGMDVDDHQGAALAAGYFLDLHNYMYATGDTARFEAMSGPDCNFCTRAVESVESVYGNDEWMEGGDLEFDISQAEIVLPTADQPAYTVQLDAEVQPLIVHRLEGPSDPVGGDNLRMAIGIRFIEGRFVVLGVNYESA